jgi:phospholipid/cholesterol/gamma-HCH transport system substrate-binding protein
METRAKFALIGVFTLCVIAAAFGFVFWFSGSRGGANLESYQVVFDTPVTGLSRGGAVLFNGIRVGEVTDLSFYPRDPRLVVARVDIAPDVPIKVSTKARLEFSGLTGVASVQIFDSDPKSPDLKPKQGDTIPTLRAIPTPSLQNVLETVQTAGKHADDILVKVDQIVSDNQVPINHIIANIEKLSEALDAAKINTAVDNISAIASKFDVEKLNHAISSIDTVVSSLDTSTVNHTLKSVDSFATALGESSDNVRAIAHDANEVVAKLKGSVTTIDNLVATNAGPINNVIANLDKIVGSIDAAKINRTVDGIEKFASALRENSARVNEIAKSADELFAKLDASADKVDQILNGANNLVNSPDGKSAFAEFAEASRSVRKLADDLDKRSAELLTNLNRFSGSGLRDIQQFAVDGRRTLGDISRTLESVQRNPQQFIFGGKASLPEYGN